MSEPRIQRGIFPLRVWQEIGINDILSITNTTYICFEGHICCKIILARATHKMTSQCITIKTKALKREVEPDR